MPTPPKATLLTPANSVGRIQEMTQTLARLMLAGGCCTSRCRSITAIVPLTQRQVDAAVRDPMTGSLLNRQPQGENGKSIGTSSRTRVNISNVSGRPIRKKSWYR